MNEADSQEAFRDSIESFVECYRDLEDPDSFLPVPRELADRVTDLAVQLVCVAFFPTAPSHFIERATAVLEQSAGSPWLTDAPGSTSEKPWVRALLRALALPSPNHPCAARSPQTALLLLKSDGTDIDPRDAVRLICFTVQTAAPDAPAIFARLANISRDAQPLTRTEDRFLRRALAVVRELQEYGIAPDGTAKPGRDRMTRRRAASNFAEALDLTMQRRNSRLRTR